MTRKKTLAGHLRRFVDTVAGMQSATAVSTVTGKSVDLTDYLHGAREMAVVMALVLEGEVPASAIDGPEELIKALVAFKLSSDDACETCPQHDECKGATHGDE